MNLAAKYKEETGQSATYRKGGADFHTLRYVRWLEAENARLRAENAELVRRWSQHSKVDKGGEEE